MVTHHTASPGLVSPRSGRVGAALASAGAIIVVLCVVAFSAGWVNGAVLAAISSLLLTAVGLAYLNQDGRRLRAQRRAFEQLWSGRHPYI